MYCPTEFHVNIAETINTIIPPIVAPFIIHSTLTPSYN
jgi:hypothetical protein